MIRACQPADLSAAAEIWLEGNLSAHQFIPARYWRDNFDMVREQLAQAELYVDEDGGGIRGFIGLRGDYIAGIFVRGTARSQGVGKRLLDFVKEGRTELTLHVYEKNLRAAGFYRREGFLLRDRGVDESTGEAQYQMVWRR